MQANKFVKKFGWVYTKHVIANKEAYKAYLGDTSIDELKRLVKSWEFVEEHGGFEQCKRWYKESPFKRDKYIRELKQAIADVESCQ